MRHLQLLDGMHLLSRRSREKGDVEHYAIGIAGIVARVVGFSGPVVIELSPSGWTIEQFMSTAGWRLCATTSDEGMAVQRLNAVLSSNLRYDVIQNNCEHVARFVVLGVRESKQMQAVAGVILVAGLLGVVAVSARRA